ncbi:MAG: DNA-processing protein DprA [Bacteroidetes bacterium]|nr:DNA-processing protein DprA [Bacteroidota bacterium]
MSLLYEIALTLVPGIGDVLGKKLVSLCGSAEAIFREQRKMLRKVPRINHSVVDALGDKTILERAEREVEFVERYRIRSMFFLDNEFPFRLKNCFDGPLLLYFKGNANLNNPKVIGVVGTRNATDYGKEICRSLIDGLQSEGVLIVSGLAYGIDSCAHRASLETGLETVGVLGHGLDRIYPYMNKGLAERMIKNGGLLTDFTSGNKPDRENFPRRNRIIAGLCDALVVVEAAQKGGALITAGIANSYNRDVFAVPGRIGDLYSEGTNWLVKSNKAVLIQSAGDIKYLMGWDVPNKNPPSGQKKIFIELTEEEKVIVGILTNAGKTGIDELAIHAGIAMSKVSVALINLEFEGVVKSLPGKVYELA